MRGNKEVGHQKITTALMDMPGLQSLSNEYKTKRPLKAISILACITPTPETGAFLITLQALGAKVAACSDNAFAADDDVVAYLTSKQIKIFAKSNMTQVEYFEAMDRAITIIKDDSTIHIADDGCDITRYIAEHKPYLLNKIKIISEQTTCGINHLQNLFADNKLSTPAIDINHCFIKEWFDNSIGIQQSLIHALTTAGISLPGKTISIFGYGYVGRGAAHILKQSGARIAIVETNIMKLMQAEMEGYAPISAAEALQTSDLCLTASGCNNTISKELMDSYAKDKLILGNIGHGTEEYDEAYLKMHTSMPVNQYLEAFTLKGGQNVYSLCQGALVNFLAGGGNMPRVMDITFTLTILVHLDMLNKARLPVGLHMPDKKLEEACAKRSFSHLLPLLYDLTSDQKQYLNQSEK